MKVRHLLGAFAVGVAVSACSDSSPSAPTTPSTRLSAVVSPNPLTAPDPGTDLLWNLELRAGRSGSVLILTGDITLLDASGTVVGQTKEFWSQAAGCASCSTDVRMAPGTAANYSSRRVRYSGGGKPVRFTYTLSFMDDQGSGTTTVDVPVQ